MRVMLVCATFPPDKCGIGDYTAELARHLRAAHVETLVLTSQARTSRDGPPACRTMREWRIGELAALRRAISEWQPDIVHVQHPGQGYGRRWLPWLVPLIAFSARRKVVQTWHERYSRSRAPRVLLKAVVPGALVVVRPDYVEGLHPSMRWSVRRRLLRYIESGPTIPVCALDSAALAALRDRYLDGQRRLIVFFGFLYPHKRVEQVFDVCDPATDRIVIAGEATADAEGYRAALAERAASPPWTGKATLAGFMAAHDIAALLAAADAVVLPFQHGGGNWNTSIHAATSQGTFVVTTSTERTGYDAREHVWYTAADDVDAMRTALSHNAGRKRSSSDSHARWTKIAAEHAALYRELTGVA